MDDLVLDPGSELDLTEDAERGSSPERHLLPSDLETIPPGPFLAAVLSAVSVRRLNGHDAVRFMKASARLEAHFAAQRLAATAEVAYSPASEPDSDVMRSLDEIEFAAIEVATALNLTRRAADEAMGLALALRDRLSRVWTALHDGDIDLRRARVLTEETSHLPDELARNVVERVGDDIQRLTTGQLRARVRRECVEIDPEDAANRYDQGLGERRLIFESGLDGTGEVHAYGAPLNRVAAVGRRINGLVRSLKNAGDPRTSDQLRVDVFLDLLEGVRTGDGNSRTGVIELTVPLETLVGLSDAAGEIPGYGPVVADIARQMADDSLTNEWRFSVTEGGQPVFSGTTRRRPDAAMRRRVLARNRTCVFPGCRMPSGDCDIDHTEPFSEGGLTTDCNLAPMCRYHHRAKHGAPWEMRSSSGPFEFTSPLAHTYTSGRSP